MGRLASLLDVVMTCYYPQRVHGDIYPMLILQYPGPFTKELIMLSQHVQSLDKQNPDRRKQQLLVSLA